MIPTRLTLSNFMCYRADSVNGGPPSLDLDGLHVVCLAGENGAGKSALLDAITWALWGQARTADDDLIAQGASEMFVEMEFLLADQPYRVRRARQRGGTGKRGGTTAGKSQLDLMVKGEAGWRTLSETSVRETQARIEAILRMSYQTFINASFLLQGRADEFTARTPAERKQVLAEILDLGAYADLEARAKERARELDGRLKSLRGELEGLRETASQLAFWAGQVAEAERQIARLSTEVEVTELAREAANRQREELGRQAEQRKELLRRLEELRERHARRRSELAELQARISADEALLARGPAIQRGLEELAAARRELERLDGLRSTYQQLLSERVGLQAELKAAHTALRGELERLSQSRDRLRDEAARRTALNDEITSLTVDLAALDGVRVERDQHQAERQLLETRLAHLNELRLRRSELQARIAKREDALTAAREEQGRLLHRLERQLADEPAWQQGLAEARSAAARLSAAEAQIAALRQREHADLDQVAELQATCKATHAEGEKLKKSKALLGQDAQVCPVCRNELGSDGVARVHAHYDEDLAALRGNYSAARRAAEQGEARLKATRAELTALERELTPLRSAAARGETFEQQLVQAGTWRSELARAQSAREDLQAQIAARSFEPEAQAELATLEPQLAALGQPEGLARERALLDQRLRELEARLQQQGRLEATLATRRDSLAAALSAAEALPAAEQQVTDLKARLEQGDFAQEVRQRGRDVETALKDLGYSDEVRNAVAANVRAQTHWEQEERAIALAEQRLSGDRANLVKTTALQERDETELARLIGEEQALAKALTALPVALAAAEQAEAHLRDRRRVLQVTQKEAGERQGYLRVAQTAADSLARREDEERMLIERQGLFAELAEAFGKKGVQAMLIESAIPQIEDEANRLLSRMTDGQMHLSFAMQRDTKKGDTVETLEITIADALGTRSYDAFSGGEAMRANFAIRIALSRLLAHRAGARLETLVVDEGFGTLDALGRERMVEAITSVQADFRRIIVITHIDELKDRFPAQIAITKTPAGSHWELG